MWIATLTLLAFGWIGFLDDYAKVTKQRNLGLSGKRKLLYQFLVGFCFAAALLFMRAWGDFSTAMNFPFFKSFKPSLLMPQLMANPWTYVLGVAPFCIFVALVVVFTSNAVNLTDGLDGLAIGLMVIAAGALTVLTYAGGHAQLAQYLQLARNPRTAELTIFCGSMTGRQPRLPLVQRAPRRDLHGRRRFARPGRRHGRGGGADQAGSPAALHRRHLHGGSHLRDPAGGQLQAAPRQTHFQNGAAAPSLRGAGLDGIEDHRALLDRRPGAGAVRADDAETEMNLKGTKALVVGMKKSGLASAALLAARGRRGARHRPQAARRTARASANSTSRSPSRRPRSSRAAELIVLSPDVPADLAPLEEARRRGVPVIGEVELAAPFLKGRTIGITGSNGKTTTTSLIGHILRESGVPVQVGGNIGVPVTAMIDSSRDDGWNVLELSSFQLETIVEFRAHIALALNVTQNHLDRHHTFENYAAAKGRLFETQRPGDFAVLNADDAVCVAYAARTAATPQWFSSRRKVEPGASLCGDKLILDGKLLMQAGEIPIRGRHNVENVLAASIAAARAGVSSRVDCRRRPHVSAPSSTAWNSCALSAAWSSITIPRPPAWMPRSKALDAFPAGSG